VISVAEARQRIVSAFSLTPPEAIALEQALGRVLAEDAVARHDQPPFPVSAMDGYAVRSADAGPRRIIGEAPAGRPFAGVVGAGEAIRIFTGGVVPDGADAVVIQENVRAEASAIVFDETPAPGRHVRPRGIDFKAGETLAPVGRRLTARDLALLAAGDCAQLSVRTRPRIAIAATGDELSCPGEARKPGGIAASANVGLAALVTEWGGAPHDLGILPDRPEAITTLAAAKADLIVTIGGASVGDHDLIRSALAPNGLALDFWKVAMRPGKPVLFGKLGETPLLGLPGNPVSALVTALLFLKPAIAAMLGRRTEPALQRACLAAPLPANGEREDYLRAAFVSRNGESRVAAAKLQDSAMLSTLARADCLIVRPPHAPTAAEGDTVEILSLE
jgi:molybdopterin molybdotransferase